VTATPYSDFLPYGPTFPDRRTPSVPNQLLFREMNEQIYLRCISQGRNDEGIEIVCECELGTCLESLAMSVDRYEAIRQFPTRFVLKVGHPVAGDEQIVERHDEFSVVEKSGPSAQVAVRLDPHGQLPAARPATHPRPARTVRLLVARLLRHRPDDLNQRLPA
jgi:hypothetical protein